MDKRFLDSKYVDINVLNNINETRELNCSRFLDLVSAMKNKAKNDFNESQANKDSANGEEAITLHAEYELLDLIESLALNYLKS
nr:MAG TPA: hypothetical protein [Bacteriophage sp.]